MFGLSSTPTTRRMTALLAALMLVALAAAPSARPARPATTARSRSTTSAAAETEPSPEIKNEPHVSCFHVHFFFADTRQTGDWWINAQPPTAEAHVWHQRLI